MSPKRSALRRSASARAAPLAARRAPQAASAAIRVAVAHSILDACRLASICKRRYDLDALEPARAQLLAHGQNDWYALAAGTRMLALRVLKAGSRSARALAAEIQWQLALAEDFPVPAPLRTRDGAPLLRLAAPEGRRLACLYEWIDGHTLDASLGIDDAREAGVLLARLHTHRARLRDAQRRHDLAAKLARTAAALDAACQNTAQRRLVALARRRTASVLGRVPHLPQGALHGDLHFGNLRRDARGRLWLLDFDDCGLGALCVDLTAFSWRNASEALSPKLDAAFIEGYESVRVLLPAERRALPALRLARALYLAGVLARDRNKLGRVPGFERPWPHYLELVRRALDSM